MMPRHRRSTRIIDTFAILSVVFFLGIGTKWYQGTNYNWVNNSLSGFFYVIFWCLVFSFPGIWKKKNIAIGVFLATSILEFLQLWHLPILNQIRSYTIGSYLIGNVFQWTDFIYYAIGCFVGYIVLRKLSGKH
jgi:hypothetical protein